MPSPVGLANILLVEDDPALRDVYRQALLMARYVVSIAGDGLTALAKLEVEKPDVVILDLGLPRVSGWDVYRDLRSRPSTALLPVIIVTGNDSRDIRPEHVAGLLQKPVDPAELVAAVDQALNLV